MNDTTQSRTYSTAVSIAKDINKFIDTYQSIGISSSNNRLADQLVLQKKLYASC